jgi:glyoxylase-like metal-dependent hydrolase (beta-lactamase superfamily II)
VKSAPAPAPAVNVTVDSVAPGVWLLGGQSHNSVAIEMRDRILLVEAPLSEARTLAVIRRVRELRPEKPVTDVIATHHHFDHVAGIRAAVSEGAAVITHEGNGAFIDTLVKRNHFVVPDQLTRLPARARIETVGAKRVLTDGARTVELHHIRGSAHASTLLMVYLPAEKLLVEADVYSPPAPDVASPPPAVFAPNLVENIDRLGLQVERVIPIHGRVVPMSDVRAAAAAAAGAAGER